MEDKLKLLFTLNLFKSLDTKIVRDLVPLIHFRSFEKKETIHLNNSSRRFFFLLEGQIKLLLYDSVKAREVIVDILFPGQSFGNFIVAPCEATVAHPITPCHIGYIEYIDFPIFYQLAPTLRDQIFLILAERLLRAENRLAQCLLSRCTAVRLANVLYRLAIEHLEALPEAVSFDIPLTQRELAGMIGASREHVNQLLRIFKDEGWVYSKGCHIIVTNLEALKGLIQGADHFWSNKPQAMAIN